MGPRSGEVLLGACQTTRACASQRRGFRDPGHSGNLGTLREEGRCDRRQLCRAPKGSLLSTASLSGASHTSVVDCTLTRHSYSPNVLFGGSDMKYESRTLCVKTLPMDCGWPPV